MSKVGPIHWRKFEKFLFYIGCWKERTKGDHIIYWREGIQRPLVVPKDTQVPVFIIRNNLRILGMNMGEYKEIIQRI